MLPDRDINKAAWIKANQIFSEELSSREINEALDITRNTALFLLGTDLFNLSQKLSWGQEDVEKHIESLMRRVIDISIVIKNMESRNKIEAISRPEDC